MDATLLADRSETNDETQIVSVAADHIDATFKSSYIDLISKPLGSEIISCSDEWFAEAANLTTPTPPVRRPGVFTYAGAWFDGWETRRHNPEPFDWVVIKLGVASGTVKGIEIDTAFFSGNEAPAVSVSGCFVKGQLDGMIPDVASDAWRTILPKQPCGPSQRHGWLLSQETQDAYTHVRLEMHPDGGIARFRLYGTVQPVLPDKPETEFDLASTVNGGVAIACSDEHFGTKSNLLLPGRGKDMGDGWETRRSRGDHIDWVVVKLGTIGFIDRLLVDTAHFRGNFPQKVQIFAAAASDSPPQYDDVAAWAEILTPQKTSADKEHEYSGDMLQAVDKSYGFVKMVIIPDGGVKRLRVFGRRVA